MAINPANSPLIECRTTKAETPFWGSAGNASTEEANKYKEEIVRDNFNVKAMQKDIARLKGKLIARYQAKGIYENFGQKEVRQLRDKYGTDFTWQRRTQPITDFDNWAMNFTGHEQ